MSKQEILQLIESMPNDITEDDVFYALYFRSQVELGIRELDAGEGIPHEDVRQQVTQWLSS